MGTEFINDVHTIMLATGEYISASTSTADDTYQNQTIALNWINTSYEPTHLCLDFYSTTRTEFSSSDLHKAGSVDLADAKNGWTAHVGSRLRIDDISLIYDK